MLDILIKGAHTFPDNHKIDLAIKGEKIVKREEQIQGESALVIDASEKLVIPGFVDSHTHLEKALTAGKIVNKSGTLPEAIRNFKAYFQNLTEEDIYTRARQTLSMAIANGTTALRSHITVDLHTGLTAIRPLLQLKEELKDYITIQIVVFPAPSLESSLPEMKDLLVRAINSGADLLGGCPTMVPDHKEFIDTMFTLAKSLDVPLDFHVDESDEPDAQALEYLAEKTSIENYQGKVSAGHCCSLSAVDDVTAARVIKKVQDAGITIVTLPSCNMYLMGRKDKHPVRRGVTRIKELLRAGVNVSYSSDNIRDPFRPFGNADMLEEGLLTAQVAQYGEPKDLETIMRMGTFNPAQALNLSQYGLNQGDYADLVLLDAPSAAAALIEQSTKLYVLKRGKIIARNELKSELNLPPWKQ